MVPVRLPETVFHRDCATSKGTWHFTESPLLPPGLTSVTQTAVKRYSARASIGILFVPVYNSIHGSMPDEARLRGMQTRPERDYGAANYMTSADLDLDTFLEGT